MKKLILIPIAIICLLAVSFCTKINYATTWAGTASNQMVTRQALADAVTNGILFQINSFTSDSRLVTKAMAESYVNINTISGYSSGQLVPKSAITAVVYADGQLFSIQINPSVPLRYTDSTTVAGILCTSSGVGCTTSFSVGVGSPPINVSNNNAIQSYQYPYAGTYFTNCGYINCYFMANSYVNSRTVNIDVLYKGKLVGTASGVYNLANDGTIYTIGVTISPSLTIADKSALKLYYY